MSTCISSQGEFSSHELGTGEQEFTCTLCGAFDEDACMAMLAQVRASADEWWRLYDVELKRRPDVSSEEIPAEAVEAFKEAWMRADAEGHYGHRVEAGLTAALPHLATHQPTRVQPSGHVPIKAGSSSSMDPKRYSGDWLICSCDPKDEWRDDGHHAATRIPIAEYPAHLFGAVTSAARVSPSAEDVAEAVCRGAHPTRWGYRATASPCDPCRQSAPAVIALFASQPTVQEVRVEALREAADLIRPTFRAAVEGYRLPVNDALHRAADTLVRAAETEVHDA